MLRTLSAAITILAVMSFTFVDHADAKSQKKAKKEAQVARQESEKAKYDAQKAGYEAKKEEQNIRKRKAEKEIDKLK